MKFLIIISVTCFNHTDIHQHATLHFQNTTFPTLVLFWDWYQPLYLSIASWYPLLYDPLNIT